MPKKKIEINEIISWVVRVLLLVAIVESIYTKKYQNTFIGVISIIMTFYPSILKKKLRKKDFSRISFSYIHNFF